MRRSCLAAVRLLTSLIVVLILVPTGGTETASAVESPMVPTRVKKAQTKGQTSVARKFRRPSYVHPHIRKDGTVVRGHQTNKPKTGSNGSRKRNSR
jgi:hypothetical protein